MGPEPCLAVLLPIKPGDQHAQWKDKPPRQTIDKAMEVKPCKPQNLTAAGTFRVAKVTTQLPHVIVVGITTCEIKSETQTDRQTWRRGGVRQWLKALTQTYIALPW